ncbi:Amino acid permease family protein [Trichomonas vaginalis G3]|uniref:Amino acid permease family protein n=1 Tax=Trichomonas vaginalis (strain ATCC PRA-98 / G3) TaxID=412133 RepID=A2DFI6_TRIV3|nr:sodium chloride cotransporter 69, isoform E family [Trichomonas vaginalis G3]EAY20914.1 Amino acid permease family protein [Trichomonas vaginalis G3]KAI5521475.1 sodium chloride cotransporter 69, isoform E family [Trichomonas vaginalis G3]|eukprot:XP_001581900.1 Amino acid permease family protein [Trichomonas vaginalis G3]
MSYERVKENVLEDLDDESQSTSNVTNESASESTPAPPATFIDPHDFGPSTVFYKKIAKRPTVSDLRARSDNCHIQKEPPVDETQKTMNAFTGVFLPTFINLMGMTYWTRAGKLVGDCGVVYSLAIIWLSCVISIILITSLNAMGTNGEIDGSGIHYVISRTIGPDLGRCFTIFLDLSTCLGAASAIIGYSESIISMYEPKFFTKSERNDIRVIAMSIMLISVPLARFFPYSLRFTTTTHLIGIFGFILGCFVRKTGSTEGFNRPNFTTFKSNTWSHSEMTVLKFMSYIYTVTPGFTALTGGFAYTGRLKRPQKMIPKGLWWAFGLSVIFWHVTILLIGFCGERSFLIADDVSPILSFNINKWVCFVTLTVFGFHRSIAMIGYERGLVADLATDQLLPPIRYKYDLWIPLAVTATFVGIGNLDFAANINTIFFLSLSLIINYCVFTASRSHIPGWRPKNKMWSPWLSLFGSIVTLILQILISWASSIINWILLAAIYSISYFKGSTQNWGSVMQAQAWYKTYTDALSTQRINDNPKLFRINLLTIVKEDEKFETQILPFIKTLLHHEAFCIISQCMDDHKGLDLAVERRKNLEVYYANQHNIFFETVLATGPRNALMKQMLLSGVGAFRPNTVFINIDERTADEVHDMVVDVLKANFGLILTARPYNIFHESSFVDVYWLADDGGLTLLVGFLMANYLKKKLRVLTIAYKANGDTAEKSKERMSRLCERFRINAEVIGIEIDENSSTPSTVNKNYWEHLTRKFPYDPVFKRFILFADVIREYSNKAALIICTLFIPPTDMSNIMYLDLLKLISHIPTSFAFVRGNGHSVLSWKV